METFFAALWGFAIFGGPIILGLVLIFGVFQWRSRRRTLAERGETPRTEPRRGAMASPD